MSDNYEEIQIIIVDDGSTDGSCEIIRDTIARFNWIYFAAN